MMQTSSSFFQKYPWVLFLLCLGVPLIVGGIAGFATVTSLESWYAGLNKPSFNPPNWIFGPVWTTLYALMGISLFLILREEAWSWKNSSLRIFALQLLLNFLWSFFFFYFESPLLALIDIFLLWASILWMLLDFYPKSKAAALLNIPYLMWVSFASILNGAIFLLNPLA